MSEFNLQNNNIRLESIRNAEKDSHISIYSSAKLYEQGSWLAKPIKTIIDILPNFDSLEKVQVLDLGCGVGRNCIYTAQYYNGKASIDCVDILDFAIDKLEEYIILYGVTDSINGITSSIEDYIITPNKYHLIFSISSLEHVADKETFCNKLTEIKNGIVENGIVCLVINSDVTEVDKQTNQLIDPQFEVNLSTKELNELLAEAFDNWKIIKHTTSKQNYDIPRIDKIVSLSTTVVSLVAQNRR